MRTKRTALALLTLLFAAPAHAQFSKSTLSSQVSQDFPDGCVGCITPSVLRGFLNNAINSWQQYTGVNPQTGTTYTVQLSDYGQLVTLNNAGAIAVTIPQPTGSFGTFNVYIKAIGAGSATITPTNGATINGSPSLTVGRNTPVQLISDGTGNNYISQGPYLATDSSPILTGNWTFQPTSGVAITITTPAGSPSVNMGLAITNSPSGTFGSNQLAPNTVTVNDSVINASGSLAAFQAQYGATATASQGNGIGLLGVATTLANTNSFYGFGVQGQCFAQHTATAPTGMGGAGQCAGGNFLGHLGAGATGYFSVFGLEINTSVAPTGGNAPKFKAGILIAQNVGDAARGATIDAAIAISSNNATINWKTGLLFGNMAGQSAFGTDSTIIASTGSQQVNTFIDFSSYTCSGGNKINFNTFAVDCSDNVFINTSSAYAWLGLSRISSPGNGVLQLTNNAATDVAIRLQFGGTSASFPAWKRAASSTVLAARLADDSADAGITALTGAFSSTVTVTSASASALAVGLNGATNPAFKVDASTGSQAAGLSVKGAATGGTVAIAAIDSGSNTNLTLDAKGSGTLVLQGTATGAITLTRDTTGSGFIKSSSVTGGIGYATGGGVGGTVAQATNRSTAVTLNKLTGQITLVSAAGVGTVTTFTVNNTTVTATDAVAVWVVSGATNNYSVYVTAVAGNSFNISFFSASGTATDQPVFGYAVIRAANN